MFFCFFNILQNILIFALRVENNSFPRPLSSEEEKKYFKKAKNKDKKAIEILINHNLRLVAHIVKKYYSNSNDQEDLISIGTIGLIKAVKNYDFTKNIKFATFASRCIENEILMYFRQIKKNINSLYLMEDSSSLNNNFYDPEKQKDIFEIVDFRCKTYLLYDFINKILTKRERNVLIFRYGLYSKIPLTQKETAKKLNISRSYVSRIEKKAVKKLSKKFKKIY